jgi:alpha-glucosidase
MGVLPSRRLPAALLVRALLGCAGCVGCSEGGGALGGADGGAPDGPPADGDLGDGDGGGGGGVRTVERSCQGFRLRVSVLDDDTVRLHYLHRDTEQPDRGWFTDSGAFPGPSGLVVEEGPDRLRLTTAQIVLEVSGPACAVTVREAGADPSQSRVLWEDGGSFSATPMGAVSLAGTLAPGEHVYGLGEKTGAADRRGRRFQQWTSDPIWTDPQRRYTPESEPLYQAHPFLISLDDGRAKGAFLASSWRSSFDVGAADPARLALGADGGDLDLFLFFGPSPARVLEQYTRLVGRTPLPPRWALGYHQSRWSYAPASRLTQIADGFRQRGLPCDGLWLDIDYMRGFRSFTWDPVGFPDPSGLDAQLEGNGFKLTTIIDPGIKRDPGGGYAVFDDGLAGSHFVADGSGGSPFVGQVWPGAAVFPDFTRAATRSWWSGLLGGLLDHGVRGVWIDMNEPTSWTAAGIPPELPFDGDGQPATHAEVHNVYALLMARATWEGERARRPDRRPFVLTRAGFAGIQRFAAVWTGDAESTWAHLAMVAPMLQGLSVSGVPFVGSDVGGFSGGPGAELYGRWFELGTFSPFFRTHVQTGAPDQEPWAFGPEVESLAARQLALRYTLLPYLYGAFDEAARLGTPIVRPLWYELPADAGAPAHEDEFFFGPHLLVAPVTTAGAVSRPVYLPAGVFYDYYSGAASTGPAMIEASAPLGRIPLFVRAGAVIATQEPLHWVGERVLDTQTLEIFPGPPGTMQETTLYDDDGDGFAYQSGAYTRSTATVATSAVGTRVTLGSRQGAGAGSVRTLVLRVHGLALSPTAVRLDGTPVDAAWDEASRTVRVMTDASASGHQLEVDFDAGQLPAARPVDLEFMVALPPGTPAGTVYLATSARGWTPDGLALMPSADGTSASGRLTVPEGTLVLYKYTRGAWGAVEASGGCADLANRTLLAGWASGGSIARSDTVAAWRDRCP